MEFTKFTSSSSFCANASRCLAILASHNGRVCMFLEEDREAEVADSDWFGGGRQSELVVAARVAEDLPARATMMLQVAIELAWFEPKKWVGFSFGIDTVEIPYVVVKN